MTFPDTDLVITYNGELYNFVELRDQLIAESDSRFQTKSDTEVVLRGIANEGRSFLKKMDGMFALGAWSVSRQSLLLARDLVGEKPLYYAIPQPGTLVFGSEIKAVLAHPKVVGSLDDSSLREVLRFRANYGPQSLVRGIRQIKPGTYLEFSAAGMSEGIFASITADMRLGEKSIGSNDTAALIQHGQDLFMESVRRRMVADVPVGAYLSGGLDSSLVVAAMRDLSGKAADIHTFSVGFEDDPHSELAAASDVSKHLRTHHHEIRVSADDFARRWPDLSAIRDSPLSEPAEVAFAEMSEVAKSWVTVALSGEGADEIFAGYPKYSYANVPTVARLALRVLGDEGVDRISKLLGTDATRAKIAARALAHPQEADRLAQWFSDSRRDTLEGLLPGLASSDDPWAQTMSAFEKALALANGETSLRRMQIVDCLTWLPGNILVYGDRMSMAHGLEMRLPFLDKSLVAFALALPDHLKIRNREQKWVMRRWRIGNLRPEVMNRRKWGFRVPLAQWFRGPLRHFMLDHLLDASSLCRRYGDSGKIGTLLERHISGKTDASATLWKLLSTEVWYRGAKMTIEVL